MNTRNTIGVLILAAALVCAFATAGLAQDSQTDDALKNDILRARVNTLYGPVGLITVPSAYVATQGRVTLGTFFAKDKSVSANYGLIKSVDVGAAYIEPNGRRDKVFANAKVNIVPQNFEFFELGIGVIDAFDRINQTAYIVASAEFAANEVWNKNGFGGRVHAGFGTGLFDEQFIGGVELLFGKQSSLVGEYNGKKLNAAYRYVHDESLRFQAGVLSNRLFFNTTYAFDFK